MRTCWQCGWEWQESRQPGFNETCPKCFSYFHACKNCKLYSPKAPSGCRSPTTDLVADKAGKNFCEEFGLAEREQPDSAGAAARFSEGKDKLRQLFGDTVSKEGGPASESGTGKPKFDTLFPGKSDAAKVPEDKFKKLLSEQAAEAEAERKERLKKLLGGSS